MLFTLYAVERQPAYWDAVHIVLLVLGLVALAIVLGVFRIVLVRRRTRRGRH